MYVDDGRPDLVDVMSFYGSVRCVSERATDG